MPLFGGTILVGSYLRPLGNGTALRLFGAESGFVGLAPANEAGSTVYTLPSVDGSAGQLLATDGNGVLHWSNPPAGEVEPAGSDGQVQFNDNGALGASSHLAWSVDKLQLGSPFHDGKANLGSWFNIPAVELNYANSGNLGLMLKLEDRLEIGTQSGGPVLIFSNNTPGVQVSNSQVYVGLSGQAIYLGTSTSTTLGFFGATPIGQLEKANYNNWASLGDLVQALVDIGLVDEA